MLRGGLRGSRYLEQLVDLTTDFLAHYGSMPIGLSFSHRASSLCSTELPRWPMTDRPPKSMTAAESMLNIDFLLFEYK